jgi:hypothetical protein
MKARKEVFTYFQQGRLQSGSVDPNVPVEEMDVLLCDALVRGHKMKTRLVRSLFTF